MAITNKRAFQVPSLDVHQLHSIPVFRHNEYRMCTRFRAKEPSLGSCREVISLGFRDHKKLTNRNNTTVHLLHIICQIVIFLHKAGKKPN